MLARGSLLRTAPIAALVLTLAACADGSGPGDPPPAQLGVTAPPAGTRAGVAFTVQVTIRDAVGQVVPTATNVVTLALGASPSGATLSGTTTVTAVAGVATLAGLSVDKTGSYTVVATSGALPAGTSAAFDVGPGAATRLAFRVPPANTAVDREIGPAVEVVIQDQFGNTVTDATDPVAVALEVNPGTAQLSGTPVRDAVAGVATFDDLAIDRVATGYTLRATSGTLQGATSGAFDVFLAFAAITVGGGHSCGLTWGGTAYCWGAGVSGQLGNGLQNYAEVPVRVSGDLEFAAIAGGQFHTCGLTEAGAAYCWGEGSLGQLGTGADADALVPVAVSGTRTYAALTVGEQHACALEETSGDAYCWGVAGQGRLGNGASANSNVPVPVSGGRSFTAITAGGVHSCGVEATSGDAYCWGQGAYGELGTGTYDPSNVPAAVTGGRTFTTVSAGGNHACAVETVTGHAHCWGFGVVGQLGNGADTSSTVAVAVSGAREFTAVGAGALHVCGLEDATGDAYCWGGGASGRLGNGAEDNSNVPVPVSGGHAFVLIATRNQHACALTPAGKAYCWGRGVEGELGNGASLDSNVPVAVSDPD